MWAAVAQGVLGLGQSILGASKARKTQRQLENMVDQYKPNQSIMDYYNKALSKYNANPYTSQSYNQAMRMSNRNLATGLNNLQGRGSALAGVSSLVQGANDQALRAGAMAEQQQAQDLAQLGQATGMKDREDKYKFEAKYNLLSQKAGAANQTANAGISNMFGGLGAIQDYKMIDKIYG
ncbi:MAG TPA: hypothetical protein PKV73_01075 [Agriterribacter sp.]|nr:hypothetical protein [Agriterribacter sp.]